MKYRLILTPTAVGMLKAISDRLVRRKIQERIEGLAENPEIQGKALTADLADYRSLRAAGQRYRIVYRIEQDTVLVVAIGRRKEGSRRDIYALARKLLRLHLIQPRSRGK